MANKIKHINKITPEEVGKEANKALKNISEKACDEFAKAANNTVEKAIEEGAKSAKTLVASFLDDILPSDNKKTEESNE